MVKKKSYIALFIAVAMMLPTVLPFINAAAATNDIHMIMIMNNSRAYINGEIKKLDSEALCRL